MRLVGTMVALLLSAGLLVAVVAGAADTLASADAAVVPTWLRTSTTARASVGWNLLARRERQRREARLRASAYPWHLGVQSSWFYVGEPAGPDNAYIPNHESAWDSQWLAHFGGIDDPSARTGPPSHFPHGFTPRENPYYVALPYNDFAEDGSRRADAGNIPWWPAAGLTSRTSACKNRWVEIRYGGRSAYAQWEDVGPMLETDSPYVFGTARPANRIGLGAGIDLSPAVRDYLGASNTMVDWRFVDESIVPSGPWKNVVTTGQVSWD